MFRILMATEHYYPYPGGITEHVYHLSKELNNLGNEVHILTTNYSKNYIGEPPFPKVIRVGRAFRLPVNKSFTTFTFSPLVAKQIRDIVKKGKYDIVHAQGSIVPTIPYLAIMYSESINFSTFHASHGASKGYEIFKPVLRPAFNKLHGRIAVSKSALETIRRHFEADYKIISNGVDIERFSPEGKLSGKIKRDDSIKLLFVGRLEPRKGLKYLISAMNILVEKYNVTLYVAGDGPLKPAYRQYIGEKTHDRIIFLGYIHKDELPSLYRSCDIFISPAIGGESFGIVLLEAMATQKPVVATRISGYMEVIEEGKDGLLAEPKDPASLARKISILIENEGYRNMLATRGREKVLRKYTWEKVAKQVLEYYKEIYSRYSQ